MHFDALVGDGRAQFALDGRAALDMGVHRRFEEAGERAPLRLGAVERKVGAADQIVGGNAVVGRHRDADADAERGFGVGDLERLGDRLDDAPRQSGRIVERVDLRLDDGEFVAADARHQRAFRGRRDALGEFDQRLVADQMAVHVVDRLEAVEVEHQHGGAVAIGHDVRAGPRRASR